MRQAIRYLILVGSLAGSLAGVTTALAADACQGVPDSALAVASPSSALSTGCISRGGTVSGSVSNDSGGGYAKYVFVADTDHVAVSASFGGIDPTNPSLSVAVYGPNGAMAMGSQAGGMAAVGFATVPGQVYTVAVEDYVPQSTASFVLNLQ